MLPPFVSRLTQKQGLLGLGGDNVTLELFLLVSLLFSNQASTDLHNKDTVNVWISLLGFYYAHSSHDNSIVYSRSETTTHTMDAQEKHIVWYNLRTMPGNQSLHTWCNDLLKDKQKRSRVANVSRDSHHNWQNHPKTDAENKTKNKKLKCFEWQVMTGRRGAKINPAMNAWHHDWRQNNKPLSHWLPL